jgi:hypothetical protein
MIVRVSGNERLIQVNIGNSLDTEGLPRTVLY